MTTDNEFQSYIEAFVEDAGHGYRFRVCESDPGLMHIRVQEFDDKDRVWRDGSTELSFDVRLADRLCESIQAVAKQSEFKGD